MLMQVLIGVVLFMLLVLAALPFWLRRPAARVPGDYYLRQTFRDQVVDVWRDYRITLDDYRQQRHDPSWLGREVARFAPVLANTLRQDYRNEMRVWLDDLLEHEGEEGLLRAIIIAVIDFQCGGQRGSDERSLQAQSLVVALHHAGLADL